MIDFWAEWCGPCVAMSPVIDDLAADPLYTGKVKIGKMNVDHNPITPTKNKVRSIPTILFFKNGKVVEKLVGGASRAMLVEKIEAALAAEV